MDDLDALLTRLAQAPVPTSLDGMEARIFARIAARPARARIGIGSAAIAVALGMGVVGAGVPARETSVSPLSLLGPVSTLAPSTLLGGEP